MLTSMYLPSARIVEEGAFFGDEALAVVKFGSKLERIEEYVFCKCLSLERFTIPLIDDLVIEDNTFQACGSLKQVDRVEGELHKTIVALHLEGWRTDMNEAIDSINRNLPDASAGSYNNEADENYGEKTRAVRRWIRSVLQKIRRYQGEHQRLLDEEVATTLQLALHQDIVMNNVLPFLELPSHTFEVGVNEDEEEHDASYSEGDESEREEDNSDDEEEWEAVLLRGG